MESKVPDTKIRPVVCCAGENYVICIPTRTQLLIRILCGDAEYTCSDNGVLHSDRLVQQFVIPRSVLEAAGAYTVRFARMLLRKPYHSEITAFSEQQFSFKPVPAQYPLRIVHFSDTHGEGESAIRAASYFSKPDLLILNGDISSSSNTKKDVLLPLKIAYAVTKGEIPCIITRGNHDLRGRFADKLSDIYPTDNGKMYYTAFFPGVRFLVLDCGEDKVDSHAEYGGTVAFHDYRLQETDFLKKTSAEITGSTDTSPLIILSHIPFPHTDGTGEFAIEQELYSQWCRIIRDSLHPAFGLFGHHHQTVCYPGGDPFDTKGLGCPIVLGGKPGSRGSVKTVTGAFITLWGDRAVIEFADGEHVVTDKAQIDYRA